MDNQTLMPIIYALVLLFACWALITHYQRYRKPIAFFYTLLLLYTGYAAFMEYYYHRNSITTTASVSAVRYTSSFERRTTNTCSHLRGGRTDCSALYDYDLSGWGAYKAWTYHVEGARTEPASTMCVNIVKKKPAVGKPCENVFFNVSPLPVLIAIWAISAFAFLTLALHWFKLRRMSKHSLSTAEKHRHGKRAS